ncbi:MAG: hypothetical protein QM528_02550 [Phycisphaerales bacterium]|nr:hypothetical protein [Phycisphaerales bacterium]
MIFLFLLTSFFSTNQPSLSDSLQLYVNQQVFNPNTSFEDSSATYLSTIQLDTLSPNSSIIIESKQAIDSLSILGLQKRRYSITDAEDNTLYTKGFADVALYDTITLQDIRESIPLSEHGTYYFSVIYIPIHPEYAAIVNLGREFICKLVL